VRASWGISPG